MFGRRKTATFLLFASLFAIPTTVFGFRSGPPSGFNGSTGSNGVTCSACHDDSVGSGSVQILGVPAGYHPNVMYDLIVRVQDPAKLGAGFQLSVEDVDGNPKGTLIITDAVNTQANLHYVNHTLAGVNSSVTNWAANGNSADFNVRWQAPPTQSGLATFWAVGNAINNNNSSSCNPNNPPSCDFVYATYAVSAPIPAASEWGLIAMTLSVLAAGSIVLGGHRLLRTRRLA